MKLFYLLALEGLNAQRRQTFVDECDRDHLPDIPHAEWYCTYNGEPSSNQHPDECVTICNGGFVHDDSGRKTFTKCRFNARKNRYQWGPRKLDSFSSCIPDEAPTCGDVPVAEDLTFFLLQNAERYGTDGYSDDGSEPELQAMFAGSIPIPSTLGPTDEWMMFIDFGPDVDISGVEFASVNALVVTQTVRHLILRHREWNGDISDVRKIDVQGRTSDPFEYKSLGPFPNTLRFNHKICDEVERLCLFGLFPQTKECETAIALHDSICGPWIWPILEGSGEEGSGASGE